jgi:thiol:disulfide interchange protein DsbC
MMYLRIFPLLALLLASLPLQAEVDKATSDRLSSALTRVLGAPPDRLSLSPISGIYEVSFAAQIFYISADGLYLFTGDLFDLQQRSNLTDGSRAVARKQLIDKVSSDSMIIYPAKGAQRFQVTIFTDIDCGYCRKLHSGMEEMNRLGISVRYLAFPRSVVGSESYNKAVSVWCATDRRQAMDSAKAGKSVTPGQCDNPVADHMALGEPVGVTGTPAIVLENGDLVPGYLEPQRLLAMLEQRAAKR